MSSTHKKKHIQDNIDGVRWKDILYVTGDFDPEPPSDIF
jgi:hypothetical protein